MAEQSFRIDGGIEASGIVTATTFVRPGGHSTQFLKADGSVDSRSFSTSDTNTTYSVAAADGDHAAKKLIRLNDSSAGITTVTLIAGTNINLSRSGSEITFNNTLNDTDTTYSISAADGTANKKVIRLTAAGSGSGTDDVTLAGGNNISITRASDEITIANSAVVGDGGYTQNNFTNVLKSKLDAIEASATADQTGSEIQTLYEALSDVNRFTDALKTKLDGIATSAEVNVQPDWTANSGDAHILNKPTNLLTTGNDATIRNLTGVAVTFSGNATVSGNALVTGNLTVNGTQTSINSATLNIGDNNVVLNSDETGTPSQNAGVTVERGTSSNVEIRWNETTDKWQLTNDGSAYADISTLTAGDAIPSGCILLWSGAANAIPSGWSLCDGTGSTPDLRSKFVVGASASGGYAVAATGGSANAIVVDHTHGVGNYSGNTNNTGGHNHDYGNYSTSNTGNHSHSFSANTNSNTGNNGSHSHNANMPNHNHVFPGDDMLSNASGTGGWNNRTTGNWGYDAVSNGSGGGTIYRTSDTSGSGNTNNAGDHSHNFNFNVSGNTGNTGSHSHSVNGNSGNAGSHDHNVSISGNSGSTGSSGTSANLPPYYALCYIRKD